MPIRDTVENMGAGLILRMQLGASGIILLNRLVDLVSDIDFAATLAKLAGEHSVLAYPILTNLDRALLVYNIIVLLVFFSQKLNSIHAEDGGEATNAQKYAAVAVISTILLILLKGMASQ